MAHLAHQFAMPEREGWTVLETRARHQGPQESRSFPIPDVSDPVSVAIGPDGKEAIRYAASRMAPGKIYDVMWNGKPCALRRTGEGVEFLRFYPDGNGHLIPN